MSLVIKINNGELKRRELKNFTIEINDNPVEITLTDEDLETIQKALDLRYECPHLKMAFDVYKPKMKLGDGNKMYWKRILTASWQFTCCPVEVRIGDRCDVSLLIYPPNSTLHTDTAHAVYKDITAEIKDYEYAQQ